MSNFFSWLEERKYRNRRIDILLHELYMLEAEIAYSVDLIVKKKEESARVIFKIADLEKSLPQGKEKLAPDAQKRYELLSKEIAGFRFIAETNSKNLKGLYQEVSQKSTNTKAIQNSIEFNRGLRLSNVPQLPYIEINGTRYMAENNLPVKDKDGLMIVYLEPNKKLEVNHGDKERPKT